MTVQSCSGGCRCGAVHHEVEDSLDQPIACNRSRYERLGPTLVLAPRSAFALRSDEEALTEHRFASGTIAHLFCRICGVESFALGTMPDGT